MSACDVRRKYKSQKEADATGKDLHLVSYKCKECKKWHLTSKSYLERK